MKPSFAIENIEDVRKRQGIVDTALKADIAKLKAGDGVKLSLETDRHGYETVTVRLTSVRDGVLRGRLVKKPKAPALKELAIGSLIKFDASHIHSIVGRSNSAMSMDRSMPSPTKSEILRAARLEADFECERPSPPIRRMSRLSIGRKSRRLRIEGDERERFIQVPIEKSNELHSFLRSHHIRSNPPQPYFSDCDRIQLGKGGDLSDIQNLLNDWASKNMKAVRKR